MTPNGFMGFVLFLFGVPFLLFLSAAGWLWLAVKVFVLIFLGG